MRGESRHCYPMASVPSSIAPSPTVGGRLRFSSSATRKHSLRMLFLELHSTCVKGGHTELAAVLNPRGHQGTAEPPAQWIQKIPPSQGSGKRHTQKNTTWGTRGWSRRLFSPVVRPWVPHPALPKSTGEEGVQMPGPLPCILAEASSFLNHD